MDWIDYLLFATGFFAALTYGYIMGRKDGFGEGIAEGYREAEREYFATGNEQENSRLAPRAQNTTRSKT